MGMTIEEAKKLDQFLCSDCSSDDDAKGSLNSFPVSPSAEPKVRSHLIHYDTIGFVNCYFFPTSRVTLFSGVTIWLFGSGRLATVSDFLYLLCQTSLDVKLFRLSASFG